MLSELAIFTDDLSLVDSVEEALSPLGWRSRREDSLDRISDSRPAAILIDGDASWATETAAAIRDLPAPFNGTPILTVGESGQLEKPLNNVALLGLLRRWAGPLDDHGLRAEPWTPRYRLIRLLGLEATDAMLLRLRDALDEAEPSAHRLAGIAGLCGYADLAEAWSRVDRGEENALPAAKDASQAVVAAIDRILRSA